MTPTSTNQKCWLKPASGFFLAFLLLVVTAALGSLLRYLPLGTTDGLKYTYLLHAHSHIAFLGWVYNALFVLIVSLFIPGSKQAGFMKLFWLTQLATLGMLISFPLQGYGRESIMFTTLHMFLSWVFAGWVWKSMHSQSPVAGGFLKLSLFFMLISSLGPLALGPLMAIGMSGSPWYRGAIYFYLHFQYNGWFIFALLALFYQYLQLKKSSFDTSAASKSLWLLGVACFLSLSLSILWAWQHPFLYLITAVAALLQLAGCCYVYLSLRRTIAEQWSSQRLVIRQLLLFASLAFLLKSGLQLPAALPSLAAHAFSIRNFIIAFLHLIFLGVVTPLLLAAGFQKGWLLLNSLSSSCLCLALTGFVSSQLLMVALYVPALAVWLGPWYNWGMFFASALMLPAFTGIGVASLDSGKKQSQPPKTTKLFT